MYKVEKIISGQTCRLVTYIFQFTKYFTRIFKGQNIFFPDLSYTVSQYFMTLALMAVRQEANNFEISVVVQELEFAMNLALYGLLCLVRMYVTPYRFSWTFSILDLALNYTDKLLIFRWVQIVLLL